MGNTALHLAAQGQHLEVVGALLAAGANPSTANNLHQSPADIARQTGNANLTALFDNAAKDRSWLPGWMH